MEIVTRARASAIIFDLLTSDERWKTWLMPANICPIVPLTFLKAGVNYQFIDVSLSDLCADKACVTEIIKTRGNEISGIVFVNTYGYPSETTSFFGSLKKIKPDLLIVHDKCQSIPTKEHSPYSDITLYSTGYAKYVDLSYGGYATTTLTFPQTSARLKYSANDLKELDALYKEALNNQASFHYTDTNWLDNATLSESQDDYFTKIDRGTQIAKEHKDKLNSIYSKALLKQIQLKPAFQSWRFNILVKEKNRLMEAIFKHELFASSHYQSLCGIFSENGCTNAELLGSHIVNLFNDRYFDEGRAHRICELINEHVKKYGHLADGASFKNILV